MPQTFDITVENKIRKEKRDINVYHQFTGISHIVSYNNSITLPFRNAAEKDFLCISIVNDCGNLSQACFINLPSWAEFEFSSKVNVTMTFYGKRTVLKIPPGPVAWQMKLTKPEGLSSVDPLTGDKVTVGDSSKPGIL